MSVRNFDAYTQFLMDVHSEHPGLTERSIGLAQTADGLSSYEAFCAFVDPQPGMTVVDLACGNGPLCEVLSERVGESGQVIGVDLCDAELKLAAECLRRYSNVRLLMDSADKVSLPGDSTDIVVCHMAFMLFTPLKPVVDEIARILKCGGAFAAVVPTLRRPTDLFRECAGVLHSALVGEKHRLDAISCNAVKMSCVPDLQQIFVGDGWVQEDIVLFDIDVSVTAKPEALADLVTPAFYHYHLLSAEARCRVRLHWTDLFKLKCDESGITRFHYPLSAFLIRKR